MASKLFRSSIHKEMSYRDRRSRRSEREKPQVKTSIPRDVHKKVHKFKLDENIDYVYQAYRRLIETHPRIEGRYE